ncbi:MAG: TrmH family RNA methyltransferase [Candidatus Thorarchaeota archaeon]
MNFEKGNKLNIKKNDKIEIRTPSIILWNPKYPHNVGAAVRAASCFGVQSILITGSRVSLEHKKGYRLPREERMKGYKDVQLLNDDYPFNRFENDVVPVAVELRDNAEPLPIFDHPENAVYVFGPEDGSIPQMALRHCHRFIVIPSKHCVNLAAAVYLVLYDRIAKWGALSGDDINIISEGCYGKSM